jgi:hypothetical protein
MPQPQQKPKPGTEHIVQLGGNAFTRPKKLGKAPQPLGVKMLSMSYARDLRQDLSRLRNLALIELAKVLPKALGGAKARLTFDDVTLDLEIAIDRAKVTFFEERDQESIDKQIENQGFEINDVSRANFRRTLKAVMGVDVLAAEPWLEDEVAAFTRENVSFFGMSRPSRPRA